MNEWMDVRVRPETHGQGSIQLPPEAIEHMLCLEMGFSQARSNYTSYLIWEDQLQAFTLGTKLEQACS